MFNSGVFWGILIVVIGVSLLVKHIFHLDFPIIKVVIGMALILIGIRFMFSKSHKHTEFTYQDSKENSVVFGNKQMVFNEDQGEYNSVFSSAVLDFTKIDKSTDYKIKVNSVFGDLKILVNNRTKVVLESDVVFGNISNPNEFQNMDSLDSNQIVLKLKASAVFGSIKIIRAGD
jgi:predicted membrane protein